MKMIARLLKEQMEEKKNVRMEYEQHPKFALLPLSVKVVFYETYNSSFEIGYKIIDDIRQYNNYNDEEYVRFIELDDVFYEFCFDVLKNIYGIQVDNTYLF